MTATLPLRPLLKQLNRNALGRLRAGEVRA
jgi:hypothetical protein